MRQPLRRKAVDNVVDNVADDVVDNAGRFAGDVACESAGAEVIRADRHHKESTGEQALAAIHDLIAQIGDTRLRERLAAEWARATRERKFGLVFEDHLPELLPLPKARPRKGDLVIPRGGSLKDLWRVQGLRGGRLQCRRPQAEAEGLPGSTAEFVAAEVTVVREFGEPIFPALVPVDAVAHGGGDAPWHTLIEADNYHALQLLEYLYAGQVDCIYIDPPYNTGARDWKYIDWRLKTSDEAWDKHLFVDGAGGFRATLGTWEAGVMAEEMARDDVVGWLRNLDRKPWSLEIPYEVGGEVRPMFPDLVLVRGQQLGFAIDILEPHDPSLADNVDKVKGLARFAERHGALFGRIQLIRKLPSRAGGKQFKRLEINQHGMIQRLLLISNNAQLDAIFSE